MGTNTLKKLRIFVASPSDVASERAKVETVIAALKPLADCIGVVLEICDWREAVPDMGRPQQVIFEQLKPTSWDVFMGILWHRFGTPPAAADAQRQREYLSGTEEEFWTAYRLWKEFERPQIWMYRCTRQVDLNSIDLDQAKLVKKFFDEFDAVKGEHPGLYQLYDSIEAFEKLLLDHLQKLLIDFDAKETRVLTSQSVSAIAPPRISDMLPRRAPFFGRKDKIAEAMRALSPEDRGWGVVIDGIGGIGKTALAVEVAYLCKEQGKFAAFIFVSSKRDRLEPSGIQEVSLAATTLDAFINEIARAICQPGVGQLAGEQKSRALIEALRGKKALLILDNLETLTSTEQNAIGDFLRKLPPDCKAIVTSRRRTGEAAVTIRLEKLEWDDARELIENEMTRHPDVRRALSRAGQSGWKQLYDEAGGSPLALTWTIGLVRARGLRFEDALALLRDGSTANDLNAFIYSEAQKWMDANERAALCALSFFGGPATFGALSATASLDRRALDVVLERLRALSLVDVTKGGEHEERFTLHPLTKRFARADLLKDAEAERTMGVRFAKYWVSYAQRYGSEEKENCKIYDRLEAEWANLSSVANWLRENSKTRKKSTQIDDTADLFLELANALSDFLWFRGYWDERTTLNRHAYTISASRGDWNIAGWQAYDVAWIYGIYARNLPDKSKPWVERCVKAWSKEDYIEDHAEIVRIRGLIALQHKRYRIAERLLKDSLPIYRQLKDSRGVVIVLNDLGKLACECKRYGEAGKYYREALEKSRKIKLKEGQSFAAANLGELALERKRIIEAGRWFKQAFAIARKVGRIDLIARIEYGYARAYEAQGRADLALPLAREALGIYERLQHKSQVEVRELVEGLQKTVGSRQ